MHEHFRIPESNYDALKISIASAVACMKLFGPSDEGPKNKGNFVQKPFSYINLLHYIDNKGAAFMIAQKSPDQKIAKAMFDQLGAARKLIVYSYIEWTEDQEDGQPD